jgi:hypothetical protein
MRKIIILFFTAILIFSLVGCKSPSEMAAEKIAEEIAEDVVGGEVDIDGEQVTVTDAEGETTTLGGTEWPGGEVASIIPKFKNGVVTYVVESDTECYIQLGEVEEEDFAEYLEMTKEEGFTENTISSTYDGGTFYTADNGEGIVLNLACNYESNELLITVSKPE